MTFERGFATFFMNRTNRSGVIATAGVIGGNDQTGKWKIGARFDRETLIERVRRISTYRDRIKVSNLDAIAFLSSLRPRLDSKSLVYLDPPYYVKGRGLYANFYTDQDHRDVHAYVTAMKTPWIVSYDDVNFIRALYGDASQVAYSLKYAMINGTSGGEVMYFSPGLIIPDVSCPASIPQSGFALAMKRIEARKQQQIF
jgi:DNA adenine methylase